MILEKVHEAAAKRILFVPHAISQMSRSERMITTEDVMSVVSTGEIIEDYPDDKRGHSCLLIGQGDGGRTIHVLCAPKDEYLAILTAYLPIASEWSDDFKRRRKP